MRNSLMKLVVVAVALSATLVHADEWPTKPIRIISPFPPGGSVDQVARVLANALAPALGQPVIVENRGGAAGSIGTGIAAKSPPDGYTFVVVFDTHGVNPSLIPNMGFDTAKDLAPIMLIATSPMALVTNAPTLYRSLDEVIAAARSKPESIGYGTIGSGSLGHLAMTTLQTQGNFKLVHVPYKGGAPAATDLMGGRIAYYFAGMPVGLPLAKSGRAPGIAVTSRQRFPGAPDIPTVAEQGLPEYEATLWQGFFAPASMPADFADKISRDVQTVLAQPETRAKLAAAGVALFEDSRANFQRFFVAEIDKWRNVVKKTNLKLE